MASHAEDSLLLIFKEKTGFPVFVTDSSIKLLFISSLVSNEWKTIFNHVHENTFPSNSEDRINRVASSMKRRKINADEWEEIIGYLDESALKSLPKGTLESSSKEMRVFSRDLSKSMKCTGPLDSLILAKAYLMVYQKRWKEFLPVTLKDTRYDTRNMISQFVQTYKTPNTRTLCEIFSTME